MTHSSPRTGRAVRARARDRAPTAHERDTARGLREIANCGPVPKAVYETSALGTVGTHRIDAMLAAIPDLPARLVERIHEACALPPGEPLPPALVATLANFLRRTLVRNGDAVPTKRRIDDGHDDDDARSGAGPDGARAGADVADDERRATRALVALRHAIGVPALLAQNIVLAQRAHARRDAVAPPTFPAGLRGDDDGTLRRRTRHIAIGLVLSATCSPPLVAWHRTPSPRNVRVGEWLTITTLGEGTVE